MIIVKLKGGLGNQMFQYALALVIAKKHNTGIKFDLTLVRPPKKDEDYIYREYALDIFNIEKKTATVEDISKYRKTTLFGSELLRKAYNFFSGIRYINEKAFSFTDIIPTTRKHTYINGYWQTEKYFELHKALVKDAFKLNINHENYNKEILAQITNSNSVSIFVRRQEYVYNKRINNLHGVLPMEYYKSAVKIINSSVEGSKFFIFSDDIEWCKINFNWLDNKVLVEHNDDGKKYEKYFNLISSCKYHIIANSSYSWWAAWLSDYEDKIIIAPKKWVNEMTIDTEDIVPQSWIKI